MTTTSADFRTLTLDDAATRIHQHDLTDTSEAMEHDPSFTKYLDREEPYIPPTTLFDRGIVDYTDEVKAHHKRSPHFRSFLFRALLRYMSGDWGDICDVDRVWNNSMIREAQKQHTSTPLSYSMVGGNKIEAFYEYREEDWSNPGIVYITTEFSPVPNFPNKTKVSLWDAKLSPDYD